MKAWYSGSVGHIEFAKHRNIHPVCLMCRHPCKKRFSFWSFMMPPEEFCEKFSEKCIELKEKVEVLEPFREGENHYQTDLWVGADGKYYITVRHGVPVPIDVRPTEFIAWDPYVSIIAGPFSTKEEAKEWFYREGESR